MRRFAGALAMAASMLSPQAGQAQDIIPRPLNSQETFTFKNAGDNVVASFDNVYIGPYKADITSGNPTLPNVTLYCVDFAHRVGLGQVWTADITSIGPTASDAPGGTMGDTRLGNTAGSLAKYRQSAFLASLFSSWSTFIGTGYSGGTFSSKTAVYSGIHAAIWTLMTAGYPSLALGVNNPALASAMATPFLSRAATALAGGFVGMDFREWSVATDVATPGTQEFLIRTQVVPEPGTYVLLLTGLVLLWAVARRRRDSMA